MPAYPARFVVVGATDGPAFTGNPCLARQVAWARRRHLLLAAYAVIDVPSPALVRRYGGRGSLATQLHRTGAAEAQNALARLRAAGLRPAMVWVDVETVVGDPWTGRPGLNNALVDGVLSAYRRAHVRAGIYSYAYAWGTITGGRRLNVPTWVPSGLPTRASGLARCAQRSFSGGPVLLGQWTDGVRDYDTICPRTIHSLGSLFSR